jgi:uncharacterized protein YndB with AHSA1/START domain
MADDPKPRPVADDELYIERLFKAPAQLVFDMWAKREHMLQWMGPKDARCVAADLDFRVGGEWSALVVMPVYGDARMGGRYLEIEPGHRIVMTFNWLNGEGDPETVITLTFRDLGDGRTLQTFHQTPFTNVPRRDSHIEGWNQAFDDEQAYLEPLARESAR